MKTLVLPNVVNQGVDLSVLPEGFYNELDFVGELFVDGTPGRLVDEFIQTVKNLPFDDLVPPRKKSRLTADTSVFYEKFGFSMPDYLIANKLARWRLLDEWVVGRHGTAHRPGVLQVSPTVHLLLGALAARRVSNGSTHWRPHTDVASAHDLALGHGVRDKPLNSAWIMELGDMLPVPAPGTPLEEVWQFREKYEEERVRLSDSVDEFMAGISGRGEPDVELLARKVEGARRTFQKARDGSRLRWISRSLSAAIALGAGYAGSRVLPDFGWLAGVVSGFVINLGTMSAKPDHSPIDVAYLHRVDAAVGGK
ncbi:DUF6236 family protein [Amycolatopsis sp. NPDC004625]|uniref:DUF6236 family protein n=1 Tax=Amycolatopsis sp. NPDC004625 TaxID=3154670 RepID=UPI0033B877E3